MFIIITNILKIILTFLSLYLSNLQFIKNNNKAGGYWLLVALYWFFNFLSSLSL